MRTVVIPTVYDATDVMVSFNPDDVDGMDLFDIVEDLDAEYITRVGLMTLTICKGGREITLYFEVAAGHPSRVANAVWNMWHDLHRQYNYLVDLSDEAFDGAEKEERDGGGTSIEEFVRAQVDQIGEILLFNSGDICLDMFDPDIVALARALFTYNTACEAFACWCDQLVTQGLMDMSLQREIDELINQHQDEARLAVAIGNDVIAEVDEVLDAIASENDTLRAAVAQLQLREQQYELAMAILRGERDYAEELLQFAALQGSLVKGEGSRAKIGVEDLAEKFLHLFGPGPTMDQVTDPIVFQEAFGPLEDETVINAANMPCLTPMTDFKALTTCQCGQVFLMTSEDDDECGACRLDGSFGDPDELVEEVCCPLCATEMMLIESQWHCTTCRVVLTPLLEAAS